MLLDRNSVGIEITDSSIAIVWLRTRLKGHTLVKYQKTSLPDTDGKTSSEKFAHIADFINAFIDDNYILSPEINLCLPAEKAIVRDIRFPIAVKENFRDTIRFEMEKYVPFSENQIYYDCQIIDEDKQNKFLTILLVVMRKEDLDPYLTMCRNLKAGASSIEINASARATGLDTLQASKSSGVHVLFFPEAESLSISLMRGGTLVASRLVPRENHGSLSSLLSHEIKICKNNNFLPGDRVGIITASDTGELPAKNGDDELGSVTSLKTDGMLPSVHYLAAYGLAVKGLTRVAGTINLLPATLRKRPDRKTVYIAYGLLALNILLFITWSGSMMMQRRMIENRLDEDITKLSSSVKDLPAMERDASESERKIDFLNSFQHSRATALDIMLELARVTPGTAWIQHFNLSDKTVQIDGYAESASDLIPVLEASPLFRDVSFLSTISKGKDEKEHFKIQLTIQ